MLAITADIDWAPDAVIADFLEVVLHAGVKVTLFATHRSPVLENLDKDQVEVGIHPNYNPSLAGQGRSFQAVTQEMLDWFPAALGVRSHSLTVNGQLLADWKTRGLQYESNIFAPLQIPPFVEYNGLVRIPIVWSDIQDLVMSRPPSCEHIVVDLRLPVVLIFHPVHVFLNTENMARYDEAKKDYHNVQHLRSLRHHGKSKGIRDVLRDALTQIKMHGEEAVLMHKLAERTLLEFSRQS